MFNARERRSPASLKREEREEVAGRAAELLHRIEGHIEDRKRQKRRPSEQELKKEEEEEEEHEAEEEEGEEEASMAQCLEQLDVLWEKVVVFGSKQEIQESLLALPTIETIIQLLRLHPDSAALFARSAQFLTPLVTENTDAKVRMEVAKGVQTFGEAYNRFGPWSHGRPRMVNLRPSSGEACADGVPAKATAVDKPASAPNPCGTRRRSACGSGYRDAAGATRKSIVDARDIRAVWEKHMAFESIRTLFFSLTKSIATTTSYESSTEKDYLKKLTQRVNKAIYLPALLDKRLLYTNRHIVGEDMLWGSLRKRYTAVRQEFAQLPLLSVPAQQMNPLDFLLEAASGNLSLITEEEAGLSSPGMKADPLATGPLLTDLQIKEGEGEGEEATAAQENKKKQIKAKTRAMVRAEIREQKLEQILCCVHILEVKLERLPPVLDEQGSVERNRNPFVIIQQWRWKEAPQSNQPSLWKSTIARDSLSPIWDLRQLGKKETGKEVHPRQTTTHKLNRLLSRFLYYSNPMAKAVSKLRAWKSRRRWVKEEKKRKKEGNSLTSARAVGVADEREVGMKRKKKRKHRNAYEQPQASTDQIPKRIKRHVKQQRRELEEKRDPAISSVVREMHTVFYARFFPPLKITVFDWESVERQNFLGRVEIDPAVLYLLQKAMNEEKRKTSAKKLRKRQASEGERRESFVTEMIGRDHHETDEEKIQDQRQGQMAEEEGQSDKEDQKKDDPKERAGEDSQVLPTKTTSRVRARKNKEQNHDEGGDLQRQDNRPLDRNGKQQPTAETTSSIQRARHKGKKKDGGHEKGSDGDAKRQGTSNGVPTCRRRASQHKNKEWANDQDKKGDTPHRKKRPKVKQARLHDEVPLAAEEAISISLPLYAGEEERNVPGLEQHHQGLSGRISITLSITPPEWFNNGMTVPQSP